MFLKNAQVNSVLPSKCFSDALTFSWLYLEDLIREFSASSLAVSEPRMTFEFSDDCQSQIEFQSRNPFSQDGNTMLLQDL